MNAQEYRSLIAFDQALTIGQRVMINWTNSHRAYSVPAVITKLNAKSVLAAIDEAILGTPGNGLANKDGVIYPQGHVIKAPRIADLNGWTAGNCVQPLDQ